MSRKQRMPNLGFKMMVWTYKLVDLIHTPQKKLDKFNIQEGDVVVDYGCGPGRYVQKASELVGKNGKIYAADIHKMALNYTKKEVKKYKLENVIPCLINNGKSPIEDNVADKIYALDMFHHVHNPETFFSDLHRILKRDGKLYLEDGHQPRETARKKIAKSDLWNIANESESYLTLLPK